MSWGRPFQKTPDRTTALAADLEDDMLANVHVQSSESVE